MDNYKSLEYIRSKVPTAELYAALAEEAAELAQAALKYRRTITKDNPTPKTEEEALQSLLEELADINTCLTAINFSAEQYMEMWEMQQKKIDRWAHRLRK